MEELDFVTNGLPGSQSTRGEGPELDHSGECDERAKQTGAESTGEGREQLEVPLRGIHFLRRRKSLSGPMEDEKLPHQSQQCMNVSSVGQVVSVECVTANAEMLKAWREQAPDSWQGKVVDDDYNAWLLAAASNGDAAAVQALLNAGANVDFADYLDISCRGITPLYAASQHGHEAVVKALLLAGANVRNYQVDGRGLTPLHAAVMNGSAAVVQALLNAGAEINKSFRALLDAGAEWKKAIGHVHVKTNCSGREFHVKGKKCVQEELGAVRAVYTVLYVAVKYSHETLVRMLLDEGATSDSSFISSKYKRGGSMLLSMAMENGQEAILRMLLDDGALLQGTTTRGVTLLLQQAVENGQVGFVRLLLQAGAPFNSTAIFHVAARSGHATIIRVLLKARARAHANNISLCYTGLETDQLSWWSSVLSTAASCGHKAIVRILLDSGAEFDIHHSGTNALRAAASNGDESMVQMLLDHAIGSTGIGKCRSLCVAAHAAAELGHAAIVQILIDAGAISDDKSLCAAAKHGHRAVCQILLDAGAKSDDLSVYQALQVAASNGDEIVVQMLLEARTNMNVACSRNKSPLCKAAESGHESVVRMLLEAGADINAMGDSIEMQSNGEQAPYGATALHHAAYHGHASVVNVLLKAGAGVNIEHTVCKDDYCKPSRHGVALPGCTPIITVGCTPIFRKKYGYYGQELGGITPLSYAVENGHTAVVDVLLKWGFILLKWVADWHKPRRFAEIDYDSDNDFVGTRRRLYKAREDEVLSDFSVPRSSGINIKLEYHDHVAIQQVKAAKPTGRRGDDEDSSDDDELMQLKSISISPAAALCAAGVYKYYKRVEVKLPPVLGGLQALEHLSLKWCNLTDVHAVGSLWALQHLDITNCNLTSVHLLAEDALRGLNALKALTLSRNHLAELPAYFGNFISLEQLRLDMNALTCVPDELGELSKLENLFMQRNRLETVPRTFGQLTALTELHLSQNSLTSVPAELSRLSMLKKLDLHLNMLTGLPAELGCLRSLVVLSLGGNKLSHLPTTLCELTTLEQLYLNGNQLRVIPAGLGELVNLKKLHIHDNLLTGLPIEMGGKFEHLSELILAGNNLTSLPETIGELVSLKLLNLNRNQLRSIPSQIGQLSELESLLLNSNHLSSLPIELKSLTALRWLDLGNNSFTRVPICLEHLYDLNALGLRHNLLRSVPDWLGGLTNLVNLNLMCNRLNDLPVTLGRLFEEGSMIIDDDVAFVVDDTKQTEWLDKFETSGNDTDLLQAWRMECVVLRQLWHQDNEPLTVWQERKKAANAKYKQLIKELGEETTRVNREDIWNARVAKAGLQLQCTVESDQVGRVVKINLPWNVRKSRARRLSYSGETELRSEADSESWQDDYLKSRRRLYRYREDRWRTECWLGRGTKTTIALPKFIGRLDGLKYMALDEKNLTSVPGEVGDLRSLEYMSLAKNYLTTIPVELGRLSVLKELRLGYNLLESVPEEFGGLVALETLHLNNNKLTSVPARLGGLSALKVLRLSGNRLTSVPAELGRLTALKTLRIDDNMLESLPIEFGGLHKLEELILNDNDLTSVPMELGMLTALTMLNLLNNSPLRTLPKSVMDIKNPYKAPVYNSDCGRYPLVYPSKASMGTKCTVLW